MEIIQQINNLPILDICSSLSIGYKKKGVNYYLLKEDGLIDESFAVSPEKNIAKDFGKTGIEGGPFDFVGQYCIGISKSDMRTSEGRATTIKYFIDKGLVQVPDNTKTFIKSLSDKDLLAQYSSLKLNGYKDDISAFLLTRGVSYSFIQKNHLLIGEIFKDIGFYDNYYCSEFESLKDVNGEWYNKPGDTPTTRCVFMFPCYDKTNTLVGIKLRRKDGKTIRGKKSLAIGKTGLLYKDIDKSEMYLVEGEMDYIIMRIMGYNNIIANLGGVQSLKAPLKSLLAETGKIICLYDSDIAGTNGKKSLETSLKRPIYDIEYPIRENKDGKKLSDVNDLYEVGYDTKSKWDKIFSEAKKLGSKEIIEHKTDFIFLRKTLEYYDRKYKLIQQTGPVAAYLGSTTKELASMVISKQIKQYEDLCYYEGGKPGHYNILDESTIIKDGGDEEPILHPHIKLLIDNICNNKDINIEWIHKAILYKLTHINDVYIPAVILYGSGKSGKGTFINLLSQIFGIDNTLVGLGQRDLEGNFDSYTGNKLIVEYKEIASGNKFEDKKVLDRLKGIVGEARITVNAKHQKVREVDNIAWFQLSSNHPVPIQLDSKHSGNRRFTVIKTGLELDGKIAEEMNRVTFNNKKIIKQYINWLYETYPDVLKLSTMKALENTEKRELENNCEGVANLFFEWFENKYPYIWKITNKEKNMLLGLYIQDIGEDPTDRRYKQSNFDMGLSHRYEKKTIKIRGKSNRGYVINKTPFDKEHIPNEEKGEFKEGQVQRMEGITF